MKTSLFSFAVLLLTTVSAFAVNIDSNFSKRTLDSREFFVYIDEDNSKSAEDILINGDDYFAKVDKNSFPYATHSVWTKVTLKNETASQQDLHLINYFAAHDEVDVYLIKNGKIDGEYFFGDTRKVSDKETLNRFANVRINLDKNETIEVVARYHSTTPINIKMTLFNDEAYARFARNDLTIWGIFIGTTLALAIYNFMMFLSLRNIAFLFYVIHSLINLYNTLTSSGHVYAFLSQVLPLKLLNISYKVTPSLAVIFMSLFIITFFDLKSRINWLYKLNFANASLYGALLVSLFFFYFSNSLIIHNKLSAALLPTALLIMILSAIFIAYKRLFASSYFLLGAGTFFATMLVYVLSYSGLFEFTTWTIYALPIGMAVEAILFSMALGQKVKRIEAERVESVFLVEESNKFNSTSYLLAGILHQFKQPLVYLGAEVLNLRTERFKSQTSDTKTDHILDNMEEHISGMNELVGNFYSFYSQKTKLCDFDLEASLDKVLNLLDSSIKAHGITVTKEYRNTRIYADEKVLNQVMLIILENAVTALKEKSIEQPTISISCKTSTLVEMNISDNAGGVAGDDINKIFNVHYSNKQSKGLGIGLPLARKFAEDKLNGSLVVNNGAQGACFTLVFPQQ